MGKRPWKRGGKGGGGDWKGSGGGDDKRTRRDYNAERGAPAGGTGGGGEEGGAPSAPPLKDQEGWILPESRGGPPALSPSYVANFKSQGIVLEGEWGAFLKAWDEPLPVTFRVNPLAPDAAATSGALRSHPTWSQPHHTEDGRVLPPPRELPWLKDAWQLGFGKADLRGKRNAAHADLHQWLITLTASGTISRQEAVSMVPPLLLGVLPHHHVLDMCAAPGSKTAQLVEALHVGERAAPGAPPASGLVVANDSDSKRAYLLTHQCARIGSHRLVVSCHDAQLFPNLNHWGWSKGGAAAGGEAAAAAGAAGVGGAGAGDGGAGDGGGAAPGAPKRPQGCFDRVLADNTLLWGWHGPKEP